MAGFFRKVAGAFVYLDDDPEKKGEQPAADLESIALETNELIAQLGSAPGPAPRAEAAGQEPSAADPAVSTVLDMTADQVFTAASIPDGANSAQRVLKIIAGLSMFPREQQVVMVRAMDAADEAWSEKDVLDDARRRQSALRSHVQAIESEKSRRLQSLAQRISAAQDARQRRLGDIDAQIAELEKLRQEAIALGTSAVAELEHERKQVEETTERARRGITAVINALSELITFFTGGDTRPQPKS